MISFARAHLSLRHCSLLNFMQSSETLKSPASPFTFFSELLPLFGTIVKWSDVSSRKVVHVAVGFSKSAQTDRPLNLFSNGIGWIVVKVCRPCKMYVWIREVGFGLKFCILFKKSCWLLCYNVFCPPIETHLHWLTCICVCWISKQDCQKFSFI